MSEPESVGLQNLLQPMVNRTAAYVTVHSYGQYWLYPWGYTTDVTKNHANLAEVAEAAVTALAKTHGINYTFGTAAQALCKLACIVLSRLKLRPL